MSEHSLAATIEAATQRLAAAGIDSARLDARLLIGHSLGLDRTELFVNPEKIVSASERRRIDRVIARRAARVPVSRILGTREFWSLAFRITPATLDPRPDSETLVESVLARLPDRNRSRRILDLGTGSGCLLLALLHELPDSQGVGIDIAPGAVRTARGNAQALGLGDRARFAVGGWDAALGQRFDVVVSNPPYLAESELAGLEPELAHDPVRALVAGPDGLAAYRTIAGLLPRLLMPGGFAALEIGATQADSVAELLAKAGLTVANPLPDLAGHDRVLMADFRE